MRNSSNALNLLDSEMFENYNFDMTFDDFRNIENCIDAILTDYESFHLKL